MKWNIELKNCAHGKETVIVEKSKLLQLGTLLLNKSHGYTRKINIEIEGSLQTGYRVRQLATEGTGGVFSP